MFRKRIIPFWVFVNKQGREYAFAIQLHCGSVGRGKKGPGRPSRYLTPMKVFKGTGPPPF